jgi:hypothetical protein
VHRIILSQHVCICISLSDSTFRFYVTRASRRLLLERRRLESTAPTSRRLQMTWLHLIWLCQRSYSSRVVVAVTTLFTIYIVTCLRHAAIVETHKSIKTLRNDRRRRVYSVPFRAAGCRAVPSRAALHHACFEGSAVVNTVTTQQYWLWTRW